jgi:hypothetical protein
MGHANILHSNFRGESQMGMIWNSPATLDMVNTLNREFSVNIGYWQNLRAFFDHRNSGSNYELKKIAKDNGLSAADPTSDGKWQTWLGLLGKSYDTANSNHEKLRKAIYDGLDPAAYDAIYFQVVPRAHGQGIKVTPYPDDDDRLMAILIETPTIAAARQLARKKAQQRRLSQASAASKKKS